MKFDKTCKVIIKTLNESEARAFILFLKSEIARHNMDIDNDYKLIQEIERKFEVKHDN